MAIQTINLGTYANDGTGDDLRTAFQKVNANFTELNTLTITGGTNLGSGTAVFAGNVASPAVGDNLAFKTLVGGPNITITNDANTVTIAGSESIYNVVEDLTPQLGGDLDLNGFNIVSSSNPANILVTDSILSLTAVDSGSGNFNNATINGLLISGGNTTVPGTTRLETQSSSNLTIVADQELSFISNNDRIYFKSPATFESEVVAAELFGSTYGTHTGEVIGNVTGNLTGEVIGNVTGNLTGEVIGTVSSLSNHQLSSLNNVSSLDPVSGQSLIWNGSAWEPGTVSSTNEGPTYLDLGTMTVPNSTTYDFGGILTPSLASLNFGTISENSGLAFSIVAINGAPAFIADSSLSVINFVAGAGIQLSAEPTTDSITVSNTAGGSAFSIISSPGQDSVTAVGESTLTLIAGAGIELLTDPISKSIVINNPASTIINLPSRETVYATTSILNVDESEDITIADTPNGYILYKISTSAASWIRVYTDTAAQIADAGRLENEDPLPNSGVVVEVITEENETIILAPAVSGFNNELPLNNTIPITIKNKSSSMDSITVSLTLIATEL